MTVIPQINLDKALDKDFFYCHLDRLLQIGLL